MKREEIISEISEHIKNDSKVWITVRNGDSLYRVNIGFDAMEILGIASKATHEICALIGGDASFSPSPIERKALME